MMISKNTSSMILLVSCAFLSSGCISFGSGDAEEDSGVIGNSSVKPAQISPDECINYVQLKRDADYHCELADGSTRALKPGERRSTPLSRDEIAQVVRNNSEDAEMCLQAARENDPRADGKIYIKFDIEAEGRVSEVSYQKEKSTYKSDSLARCLEEKIKKWRFPVLRTDETLEISYPFVLVNPELNSTRPEAEKK